jgi:hypothetical protein
MFQVFRKELMWGGRRLVLETGKIARQADGAVLATLWRNYSPVHRRRGEIGKTQPGFLSADGQLPGKDIRCRKDTRRFFQA